MAKIELQNVAVTFNAYQQKRVSLQERTTTQVLQAARKWQLRRQRLRVGADQLAWE